MGQYVGRAAIGLSIAFAFYVFIYRPLQLRWGATAEEVARAMPGDEIQPRPFFNATRAITVQAPPEQIWPWLIQIGYRRAGWYGYDWIDNDGIPSSSRILPEWQQLQVGGTVPIWRGLDFKVAAFEPDHYVVWQSPGGHDSMSLALYPLDASHTRLVWRIHNGSYLWTSYFIVPQLFTDLADFIAVRENLRGIKRRAESAPLENPAFLYLELALWATTFAGFVVAEVLFILRRDWAMPLLAVVACALLTIELVLLRPPMWIDGLAAAGVSVGLWWIHRRRGNGATRKHGLAAGANWVA